MMPGLFWGALALLVLVVAVIAAFTVRDVRAERRRSREYERRREMIRARAEGRRP